jgi:hypothetical protein
MLGLRLVNTRRMLYTTARRYATQTMLRLPSLFTVRTFFKFVLLIRGMSLTCRLIVGQG